MQCPDLPFSNGTSMTFGPQPHNPFKVEGSAALLIVVYRNMDPNSTLQDLPFQTNQPPKLYLSVRLAIVGYSRVGGMGNQKDVCITREPTAALGLCQRGAYRRIWALLSPLARNIHHLL